MKPSDHLQARPALDRIRAAVVAQTSSLLREDEGRLETCATAGPRSALRFLPVALLATLWRELVLPSRHAWSALAAVWLLLGALHLATRTTAPSIDADATRPAPSADALLAAWQAQRRQLAEFLPAEPAPAETPATPGPSRRRDQSAISRRHVG